MAEDQTQSLHNHYSKLIVSVVTGIQKKICDSNGITFDPKTASDLCPIPVFEGSGSSLLKTVNESRRPTDIAWINGSYEYLNAYIKTYKNPETGRKHSEIVVTTANYCMARFFAAKELMHCLIDDDGYPFTNTAELTRALIDDLVASGIPRTEPQTIVDEFAWVGAALYLIPESWIDPIKQTIAALSATNPDEAHLFVAQKIRAPEVVLRARLRLTERNPSI